MFRNLRCYRVQNDWPDSENDLHELLERNAFTGVGPYSEKSAGWEPVAPEAAPLLCRRLQGTDLLQLRTQSRVLPAAAVRETLSERVDAYRERTAESPSRAEIRKLREEVRDELLPKALVKSDRTRGVFLHGTSILVIDAGTPAKAEWFIDQLRPCFNQLQCVPLAFRQPPSEWMQRLFLGESMAPFGLGRECRMQDPSDGRSTGTWRHIDLDDAAIRRHVADGMRLTHLGFSFDDVADGVLADDGAVGKLKAPESDPGEVEDGGDPLVRLDAEFVLWVGLIRRLLDAFSSQMGGFADERRGQQAA